MSLAWGWISCVHNCLVALQVLLLAKHELNLVAKIVGDSIVWVRCRCFGARFALRYRFWRGAQIQGGNLTLELDDVCLSLAHCECVTRGEAGASNRAVAADRRLVVLRRKLAKCLDEMVDAGAAGITAEVGSRVLCARRALTLGARRSVR